MKAAFNHDVEVIPIGAIYDYKKFYDLYVHNDLMIRKKEETMLGFRISQLTADEKVLYPDQRVKVNYSKTAQGISIDLRPKNALYDPSSEGRCDIFVPVLRSSAWIPIDAKYDKNGFRNINRITERNTRTTQNQKQMDI